MISAVAATSQLVQRLRVRTERLVAGRTALFRRSRRSSDVDWRSATSLWPDFTADIAAADSTRS